MKKTVVVIAGTMGLLAVIFGAFGAHALKHILDEASLSSYETGVRYQMFHSLVLLASVAVFKTYDKRFKLMIYLFALGTLLFSGSIYVLSLATLIGKFSFMGPVTPLGGFMLILAWTLFIYNALKNE